MDTVTDTVTVATNEEVAETPEHDTIRIPHTLARLERYWMKNPNLRLGEIVCSIAEAEGVDPKFVSDELLIQKLEELVPSWN